MKYTKDDLPRERNEIREKDQLPYSAELVYKPPVLEGDILDETTELGKKAKELTTETQHAKSKSKVSKSKVKKIHRKADKAAVAKIQA